jgi:hypothetical protein
VNIFDALARKRLFRNSLKIGFSMRLVPKKDKDLQIYQPEHIIKVIRLHPI